MTLGIDHTVRVEPTRKRGLDVGDTSWSEGREAAIPLPIRARTPENQEVPIYFHLATVNLGSSTESLLNVRRLYSDIISSNQEETDGSVKGSRSPVA